MKFLISFCLAYLPGYAFVQDKKDLFTVNRRTETFITAQMKEKHIPGLSVAVMKDGVMIYSKAFGYCNLEHNVPAKPNTVFAIASITKSFTAIAVMMLAERKMISPDDGIGRYLMELPDIWKGITVRQLLNHTSGIPSFSAQEKIECPVGKQVREYVRGDVWKEVSCLPLLFTPGEQWSYGDTGYYLLGMLIEKVTGDKYEKFLQENIFRPLGMKDSRLMTYTELISGRADGYSYRKGQHYPAPRFEVDEFSNGGIVSTAPDMIQLHFAFTSEKLLKKETWSQMWTKTALKNDSTVNYGFGFGLTAFEGKPRMGHTGGGGLGFATALTHFPEQNLTVILLSNADQREGVIGTFVNTIASFYF